MKTKELTLEFTNKNFYNIGEVIYRKDGKQCTNNKNSNNYYNIKYKNKLYKSHRILWILYNQQNIPEGLFIDHADMNTTNNSKENLRLATRSENNHNRKISKNNTTGVKGIYIFRNKYYVGKIRNNNKTYSKNFPYTSEGLELAKLWLEETRKELHGDFANNG